MFFLTCVPPKMRETYEIWKHAIFILLPIDCVCFWLFCFIDSFLRPSSHLVTLLVRFSIRGLPMVVPFIDALSQLSIRLRSIWIHVADQFYGLHQECPWRFPLPNGDHRDEPHADACGDHWGQTTWERLAHRWNPTFRASRRPDKTQLFRGRIHKKWERSVDFFFSQHWSVLFRGNMLHLSPKLIQSEGEHAIMSGYLKEPRATLFIRTGLHEAKTVLVPNLGRISIKAAPHGLKVETVDEKVGHGQVSAIPPVDCCRGVRHIGVRHIWDHIRGIVFWGWKGGMPQNYSKLSFGGNFNRDHERKRWLSIEI